MRKETKNRGQERKTRKQEIINKAFSNFNLGRFFLFYVPDIITIIKLFLRRTLILYIIIQQ